MKIYEVIDRAIAGVGLKKSGIGKRGYCKNRQEKGERGIERVQLGACKGSAP